MSSVGGIVAFLMIGILLWSGLEKLRTLEASSETFADFRHLLAPKRAVLMLSLAEFSCVVGLVIAPASLLTMGLVFCLATTFAFGGIWAIVAKKRIRCNCFGSLGSNNSILGKAQLIWFFLWLSGLLFLHFFPPEPVTLERGVTLFASVCLIVTCVRASETLHATRRSRGDRMSAKRMFKWLS